MLYSIADDQPEDSSLFFLNPLVADKAVFSQDYADLAGADVAGFAPGDSDNNLDLSSS